jgi:hypothetical protein
MDIKRFLKQENTGQWWGGFKAVISSASGYASWVSYIMQSITLYIVAKMDIPIWLFFLIIMSFVLTVFMFEWKITIPSAVRFTNAQTYKHDNPMRKDIEKILAQQQKIMEKLNI